MLQLPARCNDIAQPQQMLSTFAFLSPMQSLNASAPPALTSSCRLQQWHQLFAPCKHEQRRYESECPQYGAHNFMIQSSSLLWSPLEIGTGVVWFVGVKCVCRVRLCHFVCAYTTLMYLRGIFEILNLNLNFFVEVHIWTPNI